MPKNKEIKLAKPLQFWEISKGGTGAGLHLVKIAREQMVVFFVQKRYLAPTPSVHSCAFCGKIAPAPVSGKEAELWSLVATNGGNQLACNGCAQALESLEVPTSDTVINTVIMAPREEEGNG